MFNQLTSTVDLEKHFKKFRENTVGYNYRFVTPYGEMKLIYADWTASGRLYKPIEDKLSLVTGPLVANTHSEANVTGTSMTLAYQEAKRVIKKHVNADENDVIMCTASGMTGAILKFQRILGLKIPPKLNDKIKIPDDIRPVVFVTHMEHHSNQTCWMETFAKVEIIRPDKEGRVDLEHFKELLEKYKNCKMKIASVAACSNVTGVHTPYHKIAEMIHEYNGWCFVDFAASAPYMKINMHPDIAGHRLDAVFFSPHKFLGGPGSTGILIFNKDLYDLSYAPEQPGGGTVKWTNPWGEYSFLNDIEAREDGGTPPFLQAIKAALTIRLKEEMNTELMMEREKQICEKVFARLNKINGLHLLAKHIEERLCIFSFYIETLHYNLGVRLLNDRYGIQVRGGCSCAGTYGHYLLGVSRQQSKHITDMIEHDDLSEKPGWIRLSLHPSMTDDELEYILDAIETMAYNHKEWAMDYNYDKHSNCFTHKNGVDYESGLVTGLFE